MIQCPIANSWRVVLVVVSRVYIPPFDHPDIWAGNSTMVDEIKTQMGGIVPDAIICSVGGGGMLSGVILGCQRAGWNKGKMT